MNDTNSKKLFKKFKFLAKKRLPTIDCKDELFDTINKMCEELKALPPPEGFFVTRIGERNEKLEFHTVGGNTQTRFVILSNCEAANEILYDLVPEPPPAQVEEETEEAQ